MFPSKLIPQKPDVVRLTEALTGECGKAYNDLALSS